MRAQKNAIGPAIGSLGTYFQRELESLRAKFDGLVCGGPDQLVLSIEEAAKAR